MPDSHLPIDKILSGHQQSLFQALRLLDRSTHDRAHHTSAAQLMRLIDSQECSDILVASEAPLTLARLLPPQSSQSAATDRDDSIELQFVDLLLKNLWQALTPHEHLKVPLQRFFWVIGVHFLYRPDLIINREHHYTQLLCRVLTEVSIWQPTTGRQGQQLPAQLEQLTRQIAEPDIKSRAEVEHIISSLEESLAAQKQRSHTLEERQIKSELANIDTEKARQSITDFIDLRLTGKPLPQETGAFISSTLLTDLQYLVITQGVESPLLKKWKRLIQILSWAFLPQDTQQQSHKINTLLLPFIEQLDDSYFSGFSAAQDYRIFFDQLIEHFIAVLQNKAVACVDFTPINSAAADAHKVIIQQTIITDLEPHSAGDWFLLTRPEGDQVRAKLLLKAPQKDLLLFSDYTGKVIKRSTFEDFSLALAIHSARPINCNMLYNDSLRNTLARLDEEFQRIKNREKVQRQIESRKRSSEKARHESEVLSHNIKQTIAHERLDDATRQQLEEQLSSLNTGSWLLLKKETSSHQKIRLSVKLKAQDKYIFTDQVGHRVADYTLRQLVELMANQQLQILSRVQGFENSLEKIVRQIRSDKS